MGKRKVLIVVHQLNLGGVQKAVLSALDAIDYSQNDVTLYIRKNRIDLLDQVNPNVSKTIVNQDSTKYYRKPYAIWLQLLLKLSKSKSVQEKLNQYIVDSQMKYEKEHYFSNDTVYDVAVSYIQSLTAKFVAENVKAKRKVMFYHGSKDEFHEINEAAMPVYEKIYCVSKGAQKAIQGLYPQFVEKIDCLENYVDADKVRAEAEKFIPDYPKDKLILCSCGRITPVKGFDLAVDTADILRNKGLLFKWYLVGDGVDRSKIEALIAEKNLQDFFEITGLQDNPYPYIKHCDIYVQPSYEESQGLTMVEAQILCKPIVSTATIGGQSVVDHKETGLIADIDSSSLAEEIFALNCDSELQESIKQHLRAKDYSKNYQRFCDEWRKLLEG